MPCANVTSASLWAASLLAALGEADADAAAEVLLDDDDADSFVAFEQPLTNRADAASAASPNPKRLCCIAHPSSNILVTPCVHTASPCAAAPQPQQSEYGSVRDPMKI